MGSAGGEQAGIGQCGVRNKLNLATFACLSNVQPTKIPDTDESVPGIFQKRP